MEVKSTLRFFLVAAMCLALQTRADTNFIGGVINFTRYQTFTGPVVLTNDTIIHCPSYLTFASTVDGPYNLTIDADGNTSFDAAVGGNTSLSSLVVGTNTSFPADIYLNNAPVITIGKQNYNGLLFLTGAVSLTSTEGGSITSMGIQSGPGGPPELIVSSAGTTTVNGDITDLSSLTVGGGGTFVFSGLILDTAPGGAETYNESVLLTRNTSVGCSNITFASSVDGAVALTLQVLGNGTATFSGPVGSAAPLTSLQIFNGSGITLLGTSITTSATQTYGQPVILAGPTALTSLSGSVFFSSSVDGSQALTLNAPGTSSFGGSVGSTTPLTSLTLGGGGTVNIDSNSVITTGAQIYNENVYLSDVVGPTPTIITLTSLGGSNITFGGTINGSPGDALTVNTTGNTTFNGIVGGHGQPYALATSSAGSVTINTTSITTSADQTYGNVTLNNSPTIKGGFGSHISFGTIDGAQELAVNDIAGTTTFNGAIGSVTPLRVLNVFGSGTNKLDAASVTTTVAQFYSQNVLLETNVCLTNKGGVIEFESTVDGAQNLTVISHGGGGFGPVGSITPLSSLTVGGDQTAYLNATIITTGLQSYNENVGVYAPVSCMSLGGENITFANPVDGTSTLTLSTTGTATLNGPVGDSTPLAAFTVTGGGTLAINGGLLNTTGAQTYNGTAALGGDTTLSGSPLSLPALAGNNHVLTLSNALVSALGGLNNGLAQLVIAGGGSVALDTTFSVPSVNVIAPAILAGSGLIIAPVTVQPGATLAPSLSSGPLTLVDSLSLSGATVMELNPLVPTNDLARTFGNIAYGGTLTVTNLGGMLVAGNSFRLFEGGSYTGAFTDLNLPPLPDGLVWDTRGLTNNGSILVAALPVLTSITTTGPDDFQLTATGMPEELYKVLATTNVALPVSQWWAIGSATADSSGTINFTDSTATNQSRFYRLDQ